jgi:hypothetical protein
MVAIIDLPAGISCQAVAPTQHRGVQGVAIEAPFEARWSVVSPDCGSGCRGFKSPQPPLTWIC